MASPEVRRTNRSAVRWSAAAPRLRSGTCIKGTMVALTGLLFACGGEPGSAPMAPALETWAKASAARPGSARRGGSSTCGSVRTRSSSGPSSTTRRTGGTWTACRWRGGWPFAGAGRGRRLHRPRTLAVLGGLGGPDVVPEPDGRGDAGGLPDRHGVPGGRGDRRRRLLPLSPLADPFAERREPAHGSGSRGRPEPARVGVVCVLAVARRRGAGRGHQGVRRCASAAWT